MLTYQYLKENPQLRDAQLKYNWAELFLSDEVPFSVKQELREIQVISTSPSDALLFWHQHLVMQRLLDDNKLYLMHAVWKSHWIDQLYSVVQLNDFDNDTITRCFAIIKQLDEITINIKIELSDISQVLVVYGRGQYSFNLASAIVQVLSNMVNPSYSITGTDAMLLLMRCSIKLIRTLQSRDKLFSVVHLLNDTDMHTVPFNSINEIQRAHDLRTERETKKLMEEKANVWYEYNSEFETVVKEHGYFLPIGPNALIRRGQQHHNCVATYESQHSQSVSNKTKRLVFSRTATIEVIFDVQYDLIIGTAVNQCKGINNRNVDQDIELAKMRIDLTGRSAEILEINVRRDNGQGDRQ